MSTLHGILLAAGLVAEQPQELIPAPLAALAPAHASGPPLPPALAVVTATVDELIDALDLDAVVQTRVKSPASLRAKAARKGLQEHEVLDRLGARVLLSGVADCYTLRDALHARFAVVSGSVDDYIAAPKANGYRSLHSALIVGESSEVVEVQLRTLAMHAYAEQGPAAHQTYKAVQGAHIAA